MFEFTEENNLLLIDADVVANISSYKAVAWSKQLDIPINEVDLNDLLTHVEDTLYHIYNNNPSKEVRLYLTANDKSNFRYARATIQPYKGNRVSEKPYHLEYCRQYLIDIHGAEIVYGMEADDQLSIDASQVKDATIATIDKDLDMCNCIIYNINKRTMNNPGQFLHLVREEGRSPKLTGRGCPWFFAQMLLGDSCDNIPKVAKGFGAVKTACLLDMCQNEEQYFNTVWGVCKREYGEAAKARFLEIAALLWMKREDIMDIEQYLRNKYEFT